ncbi:putative RtcB-like RNA-splicing ligase [Bodo saltans virus]|uniref:3'-phosphate/5'-hydroxy nucleic acid ligase n=1 Tax=Bodo saltans virus TaxID=2024608 RepID=A0A2H4UTJ8_9VIRU|nr:putative RtcB-like RNA-splicing ligase [Bodo saltans virus]ATZ80261.1 putative RtcB-like RNA-splicing ligase [Bodo saltans virus]
MLNKIIPNDPGSVPFIIKYKKINKQDSKEQHYELCEDGTKILVVNNELFNDDAPCIAKAFIPKFHIDKSTISQIRYMLTHPSIDNVRIMPDCHRGVNCCIGFTSKLTDKIVPCFIGVDIGCGIISYQTNKSISDLGFSVENLESTLRNLTPMGTTDATNHCIHKIPVVKDDELDEIFEESKKEAYDFAKMYSQDYSTTIFNFIPNYSFEWLKQKCIQIGIEYNYALQCLGTLGGGNHFIEVNKNINDKLYITLHTGSRNFGTKICNFHQSKINETKYFDWGKYHDGMKNIHRKTRDPKTIKFMTDELIDNINAGRHTDYLENEDAYEYFFDMIFAQKFAKLNRKIILRRILDALQIQYDEDNIIESIHNYIDFTDKIIRKGAISAHKDQLCLISLNMRDGILLCKGKGNIDWNYSSAHGAGRLYTRYTTKQKVSMDEFIESMKNVYSTSVNEFTLDESPQAYKNTEMIKSLLNGNVEIIEQLFPIINIKAND